MQIVETNNRFWLWPMTMLGTQTRQPVADYRVMTRDRWRDEVINDTGVHYAEYLKGIILTPDETFEDNIVEMYQNLTGSWNDVYVPQYETRFLHAYDATPTALNSCETRWKLVENPCWTLRLWRKAKPSAQTARLSWRITAMGCNLVIGGLADPALTLPSGVTKTRSLSLSEQEKYFFDEVLTWRFHALQNDLIITCSAFEESWILREVGNLPAGTVGITSYGGAYALHAQRIRFATSGYWDEWADHPIMPPAAGLVSARYPVPPAKTTAATTIEESEAQRRRYRTALTGDGYHTPLVQAWDYYYRPAFAADRSGTTDEVTEWTRTRNGEMMARLHFTDDPTGNTLEVEFLNESINPSGYNFREYLDNWDPSGNRGIKTGQCAIYCLPGYVGDDGLDYPGAGHVFLLPMRELAAAIRDAGSYRVSCRDRLTQTQGEIWWAPCLLGWPPEEAIAVVLECMGIDPRDIVIHPGRATNSKEPGTGNTGDWWGARVDTEPLEQYLADPQKNYDNPTWLPKNGSNGWDIIRRILELFGLRCEFWADLKCHIYHRDRTLTATAATYRHLPGSPTGTDLNALSRVRLARNIADAPNIVYVQGTDYDGKPLHAVRGNMADIYEPGGDRYLGVPQVRSVTDDNLATQEACNGAVARLFKDRPGARTLEIAAPFAGYDRRPPERLAVLASEPALNGEIFRAVDVDVQLGMRSNPTTIRAEEVE
ncbi:MAG: hypothetical protein ACYC6A_00835 [Armatimonadota bacterium]